MRQSVYLASLTGTHCPGRFAIKTRKLDTSKPHGELKKLADRQADALIELCEEIYNYGQKSLVRAFQDLCDRLKLKSSFHVDEDVRFDIFSQIKNSPDYCDVSAAHD